MLWIWKKCLINCDGDIKPTKVNKKQQKGRVFEFVVGLRRIFSSVENKKKYLKLNSEWYEAYSGLGFNNLYLCKERESFV